MGFCNDITPTCDVCFEVLYGECNDVLTISLGLTPSTTFYLNLTDKFDIVTPLTVTTDGSGDFTITQTWVEFFGDVEVEVFSDSGRTSIVTFVQNPNVYNCVILTQELSGSNSIITPGVFIDQFSLLFDGVDEYVEINGVQTSLASTTTGTLSAWVKLPDASPVTEMCIITFSQNSGANEFIRLQFEIGSSGRIMIDVFNNGVRQLTARTDAQALTDNTWGHVACTADGVFAPKLYIDGVLVAQTTTNSTAVTTWFNDLTMNKGTIGGRINPLDNIIDVLNGNIDEVSTWNTNLSNIEIAEIYSLGVPRDLLLHSKVANLVSWHRMGDKSGFDGINFKLADQSGNNTHGL